ncbi:DUF3107 domain-containing protein [Corynebacterium sphenisci]|uniref:DUF3107 domain-containing protein n=1 Tax=Corynebacterium sphenisci TaxID=191493 RepID=UPI0026DFB769|nr:DUF3107 domain-containing protein [Corynebacterium sphenisci]MDO5730614.1 DUF3107 domain-containing protein [Corynebacterium sphenisci]
MDITIGFVDVPRELTISGVEDADAVRDRVRAAVESGTGVLELVDGAGRTHLARVEKIAYVGLGPAAARKVGFIA